MMFGIIVLIKWMVVGKVKPGKIDLWSAAYYRWWFVNTLVSHSLKMAMPLIADTPACNILLRCLGAKIGKGCRISVFDLHDPDLLNVGAGVTIGKKCKLATSSVLHGQVHFSEIVIGEGSAVGPTAVLSQGSVVPPGKCVLPLSTMPGWHGTVGSVAYDDVQPPSSSAEFHQRQDLLRVVFGLPAVILLHTLPFVATTFALEWTWQGLTYVYDPIFAWSVFSVMLPWLYAHPLWISLVVLVVLQKWLLVGDFRKMTRKESHWSEFKHWLHGRAVESHDFEEVGDMWTNTELLSQIYRMLGTKVGRRVQIDALHLIENDCVTVGDYCVFGTDVLFAPDILAPWVPVEYAKPSKASEDKPRFADIILHRAANMRDPQPSERGRKALQKQTVRDPRYNNNNKQYNNNN
ncbi:unnamed protein product [Polarella glacialis]|uniref:Uncharacterized protein n=1 Tax=Polarella glacialis TaxID=89957 RepID=A0A813JFN2_POLGL|nr:unnamed protein product [Polarella glacialis]